MELPPGTLLMEDPPAHDVHRRLLAKVFSPRRVAALEPRVRRFCVSCLDPVAGEGQFDLIAVLGREMPMRVIGMLLGIPESGQEAIRDRTDAYLATDDGGQIDLSGGVVVSHEALGDYVDWRLANPSDDVMTELLTTEFQDEHGVTRRLTREEVLMYVTVLAGAGNETTGRLIGWAGAMLARHPEQRDELAADPSLIPGAIEEILRLEPPGAVVARYVTRPAEFHGKTVPAGSAMMAAIGAANRDPGRFTDPDRFDIHRKPGLHLTFAIGPHYCLGAALARLEGRIALEEILGRWPSWDVDWAAATMTQTSTVRGWEKLPLLVGARSDTATGAPGSEAG